LFYCFIFFIEIILNLLWLFINLQDKKYWFYSQLSRTFIVHYQTNLLNCWNHGFSFLTQVMILNSPRTWTWNNCALYADPTIHLIDFDATSKPIYIFNIKHTSDCLNVGFFPQFYGPNCMITLLNICLFLFKRKVFTVVNLLFHISKSLVIW